MDELGAGCLVNKTTTTVYEKDGSLPKELALTMRGESLKLKPYLQECTLLGLARIFHTSRDPAQFDPDRIRLTQNMGRTGPV